ncbi:MAG: creatininase family protein [Myxococcales bacterium]|nr:creatininase family protein [Myxococcales bacterium]
MADVQALRWESLTKRQFDTIDRERAVVLVSCSPLEVHGPHLPMGADALEADGLSERMLRFLPDRHADRTFLKLPFVYAATDTVPQPGSLFFQPSTTVTVLSDLGRTLAAQGFRHVFVGNFHGGPRHFLAIEKACRRVQRRHGIGMVSVFSLMISRFTQGTSNLDDVLGAIEGVDRADLEGDTHGGLVETSQLLALHGDWVDPEYKSLPRRTVDGWLESKGRPKKEKHPKGLPAMIRAFKATQGFFLEETYTGTPASASAEVGERFLDVLGAKAAEGVSELLDGTIGPEACHSPIWKLRFLFLNPGVTRVVNRLIGFRNPIA